jgi:HEAT repeat protein
VASEYRRVLNLINQDLAEVGVVVKDLTVLADSDLPPEAAPVLLRWLDRLGEFELLTELDRRHLLESMVYALGDRAARGVAGPALVALFRDPAIADTTRWIVGSALEHMADPGLLDDLIRLAEERQYGRSRQMVVYSLGRIGRGRRRDEVVDRLIALLDDESVRGHAIDSLTRLRAHRALPEIARYVDAEPGYIRDAARKAVRKLSPG